MAFLKLERSLAHRRQYKWWAFGTIAVGTFISVGDQTGVNLALPLIAEHFDATIPAVQWVTLGYVLATGSLLMPMGRLSDMIGRKRVYTIGFVIFTLAAVLTGSATALLAMICFKLLQGVGAAMVQANGMAIVTSTFPANERGKAIGLFMTVVGLGAVSGPIVAGAVVGFLGWRYIFFLGVPFGVLSIASSLVVLEDRLPTEAGPTERRPRFDWAGAMLSTSAVTVFLLVMTNGYRIGWGSIPVIAAFAGVAGLVVAFVWRELRAPEPMLALELFKRKLFALGSGASYISFLAGASVFFLMPFYLQGVLDYSPGRAGLIMAGTAVCFAISGPISGRFSDAFGWRRFTILGLLFSSAAVLALSQLSENAGTGMIVVALAMLGLGMGTFQSPNASAVLSAVERSRYGIATAFMNMLRNVANLTGIGLATAIVAAQMASAGYEPSLDIVSSVSGSEGAKAAFAHGLRTAYLLMTGLLIVATVLSSYKGRPVDEGVAPETNARTASEA